MAFIKLSPEDLEEYVFFDPLYNCWVKKPGKNVVNDKFKEFNIIIDAFTMKYTNYPIKSVYDISKYWDILYEYNSDNEESGDIWTNCMCGEPIKFDYIFYLKDNPGVRIRVGSRCVTKIENKSEDSENGSEDSGDSEDLDDEICRPLTYKVKKYEKNRRIRVNYKKAKAEGRVCNNCDSILNMTMKCCKDHKLCELCFITKKIVDDLIDIVHLKVWENEQKINKIVSQFTRRCFLNVTISLEQERLAIERAYQIELHKSTNFEGMTSPLLHKKLTLLQIYESKGGVVYLCGLFNTYYKQDYPNLLGCIKVFLKSKILNDKLNRDFIANALNIKLTIKQQVLSSFFVKLDKSPSDFILNVGKKYHGKTLLEIKETFDDLDYLKYILNVTTDTLTKQNIELFLSKYIG
jgi:hypothetical protein